MVDWDAGCRGSCCRNGSQSSCLLWQWCCGCGVSSLHRKLDTRKRKKVFKTFHLPIIASIQSFLTPFSPAPTIHQSDNSHSISDMHTLFMHTRFISVADGLKLLSCLRYGERNLISYYTHSHTHTYTHSHKLDVEAFSLVEPFIWSFYGSGPGSLNAQTESQEPLSQNTVQLSFHQQHLTAAMCVCLLTALGHIQHVEGKEMIN